jgi:hypothetical protein
MTGFRLQELTHTLTRLSNVGTGGSWGVGRVEVGMVEGNLLEPSDFGRDDHGSCNCRYLFWGRL